jgi:hypothetical protein
MKEQQAGAITSLQTVYGHSIFAEEIVLECNSVTGEPGERHSAEGTQYIRGFLSWKKVDLAISGVFTRISETPEYYINSQVFTNKPRRTFHVIDNRRTRQTSKELQDRRHSGRWNRRRGDQRR